MQSINPDIHFMQMAMDQAAVAEENGDVPIGAVIVYENCVIAKAYNQREQLSDPTAHAEIIALTQAAAYIGSWRLHGCTIYVTLEPCTMCAGALVHARVKRLVFGALEKRAGAVVSSAQVLDNANLNHRVQVVAGVLEEECGALVKSYFQQKR